MNKLKWFFMSRYKKLLYNIEMAKKNAEKLELPNGVVLDFRIEVKELKIIRQQKTVQKVYAQTVIPKDAAAYLMSYELEDRIKQTLGEQLGKEVIKIANLQVTEDFDGFNLIYKAKLEVLV